MTKALLLMMVLGSLCLFSGIGAIQYEKKTILTQIKDAVNTRLARMVIDMAPFAGMGSLTELTNIGGQDVLNAADTVTLNDYFTTYTNELRELLNTANAIKTGATNALANASGKITTTSTLHILINNQKVRIEDAYDQQVCSRIKEILAQRKFLINYAVPAHVEVAQAARNYLINHHETNVQMIASFRVHFNNLHQYLNIVHPQPHPVAADA